MTRETTRHIYFPRSAAGISDAENPTQRTSPCMPILAATGAVGPRKTMHQKPLRGNEFLIGRFPPTIRRHQSLDFDVCCARWAARIAIHAAQRAQREGRNQFPPPLGEKDGENRIYEIVGREGVGGGQIPAADQPRLIRSACAGRTVVSSAPAVHPRRCIRGISCDGLSRRRSSFQVREPATLRALRATQARRRLGSLRRGNASDGSPARSLALRVRRRAERSIATAPIVSTYRVRGSTRRGDFLCH